MNRSATLRRLEREVDSDVVDTTPVPIDSSADEAAALGQELARIARAQMEKHAGPEQRPPSPECEIEWIQRKPPSEISFDDIEKLMRHCNSNRFQSVWDGVKAAARGELQSGWRAGQGVEVRFQGAWERACFLAVRETYRESWRPRSSAESLLIDELAQYECLRHRWLRILSDHSATALPLSRHKSTGDSRNGELVVTQAAATREAILMIDRLQRLAHRATRLLLALRRGNAPVLIRRAAQVNVTTGNQLNVGAKEPNLDRLTQEKIEVPRSGLEPETR